MLTEIRKPCQTKWIGSLVWNYSHNAAIVAANGDPQGKRLVLPADGPV